MILIIYGNITFSSSLLVYTVCSYNYKQFKCILLFFYTNEMFVAIRYIFTLNKMFHNGTVPIKFLFEESKKKGINKNKNLRILLCYIKKIRISLLNQTTLNYVPLAEFRCSPSQGQHNLNSPSKYLSRSTNNQFFQVPFISIQMFPLNNSAWSFPITNQYTNTCLSTCIELLRIFY